MKDEDKFGREPRGNQTQLRKQIDKIVSRQNDDITNIYCSFCGKEQSQVEHLILGPAVNICDQCVAKCNQILSGYTQRD